MRESDLQVAVADYLRLRYPLVLFHSDFGSGVKLTMGQAAKQKRQNGGRRAWPDMFIAKSKVITLVKRSDDEGGSTIQIKFGLFLELKKEGTRLKKKNGEWATPHIAEQARLLDELRLNGYAAEFAVGFEQAKEIIDNYLEGKNERSM